MGREFGNLDRITGVTFFRLSPYEQNPFAGMIKDGLPTLGRSLQQFLVRGAPMFLMAYTITQWAHEEYRRLSRKPAGTNA